MEQLCVTELEIGSKFIETFMNNLIRVAILWSVRNDEKWRKAISISVWTPKSGWKMQWIPKRINNTENEWNIKIVKFSRIGRTRARDYNDKFSWVIFRPDIYPLGVNPLQCVGGWALTSYLSLSIVTLDKNENDEW